MKFLRLLRAPLLTDNLTELVAAFVVLTLLSKTPVYHSASIPSTTPTRWFFPCSGTITIAETEVGSEAHAPKTEGDKSAANMASTFHTLSVRANKLKRRVRELRNLYVQQRFRDESIVNDFEEMGLHLEGMPVIYHPTISSITNTEVVPTVHSAFENLARVAVFLDQARIGENLALNEVSSFERDFKRIEDHQEDGLYWILCALHQIIRNTGSPVSAEVISSIMSMRVKEVDHNAMRHTRDYIVLRDFEKILDRLSIDFASLKKLHNS